MTLAVRLPLLAAVALTGLGLTAPAQAQQASMSFFVTSVGKGNGADLGGLAGADAHCQALASAAGSTNTNWRAYLSTTEPGGDRWRQRARPHRQGSVAECQGRGGGKERGGSPLGFEQHHQADGSDREGRDGQRPRRRGQRARHSDRLGPAGHVTPRPAATPPAETGRRAARARPSWVTMTVPASRTPGT